MKLSNKLSIATAGVVMGLAAVSVPSSAQAALITGVTASTDMGEFFPISQIVDYSGLSTPVSLTSTHAQGANSNDWASNNIETGNVTFNLGGTYNLAGFSVWNFNGIDQVGVKDVIIKSSLDGSKYTTIADAPTQFKIGAYAAPESPELVSFTPVLASYVRFAIGSNYGYPGYTGLSEVQFDGEKVTTQAVPEPLTIAGSIAAGAGLISAKLKQRKKQKVSQAA
jgi:hypothetical protein